MRAGSLAVFGCLCSLLLVAFTQVSEAFTYPALVSVALTTLFAIKAVIGVFGRNSF